MNHWSFKPHFGLALLAAAATSTCAKIQDESPALPTGSGGSGGSSAGIASTSSKASNTSSTAASSTATTAASSAGTNTSAGGTGTGEAGAPALTSTTGEGGENGTDGSGGTGGVPPDVIENARIVLLYKLDSSSAASASIFMHLYLRNQGDDEFPLNAAEVRYWFDADGLSYSFASHYQGPAIGPVTLDRGDDGADEYVAITFGSSASLPANTADINSTEFQVKLDAVQGTFDQSNDYSFAPELRSPAEHLRVTVYLADRLVWGCEPSGACADDEPGAGGAAGAAGAEG